MRLVFIFCITVLIYSCSNKTNVDYLIYNANIYTIDSNFTKAQAIAIKEDKIIEVGSTETLLQNYTATNTIDAKGKTIFPGFIDAHAHFVGYGQSIFAAQLYGLESWDTTVNVVKRFAEKNPQEKWIIGRGWDQNLFPDSQFPTNEKLNTLFPNTPVLLTRIDGHAAIANAKALELAGVQPNTNLVGGTVEMKDGKLTGILIDNAVDLVSSKIPKPTKVDYEKWLMAAQQNCFAQGLTTITDCGLMYNDVDMIDALQKEEKLLMKLYVMLSDDAENYKRYLEKPPYKTDKLFVKGIKVYADGALGSRGACLLKHYADKPNWLGFLLRKPEYFDSLASVLIKHNYQMCTHAIGDSANRVVLNIYNKYLAEKNDKRWRIEHAQAVNANDFALFGKTNIVPSVQPTHATSDMYWAPARLGEERLKTAYAYQQLLQQNGWLPLGTDFPVEDISAIKTFFAAVVRKDAKGFPANGFQKENALTREQAIKGMTIWAAKANFLENETGSLQKGKRADLVILDTDLMTATENKILATNILATMVDGKLVFGKL